MLQLCVFGSYEGSLVPERRAYFTMFASSALRRPTLARELLALRQTAPDCPQPASPGGPPPTGNPLAAPGRNVIITVFGSTELKYPTLAEEFIDLREAVRSGALDLRQWDTYLPALTQWQRSTYLSFTLFGSFNEAVLPTEDEEIESLALHRHLGSIPDVGGQVLETGVGQSGSQRRAIIHQAVRAG
jgi:hypothetical protein